MNHILQFYVANWHNEVCLHSTENRKVFALMSNPKDPRAVVQKKIYSHLSSCVCTNTRSCPSSELRLRLKQLNCFQHAQWVWLGPPPLPLLCLLHGWRPCPRCRHVCDPHRTLHGTTVRKEPTWDPRAVQRQAQSLLLRPTGLAETSRKEAQGNGSGREGPVQLDVWSLCPIERKLIGYHSQKNEF